MTTPSIGPLTVRMEDLFLSENHLVLSRIFLSLDGRSLKNARLVCRGWDAFIRDHIWGCTLYRWVLVL